MSSQLVGRWMTILHDDTLRGLGDDELLCKTVGSWTTTEGDCGQDLGRPASPASDSSPGEHRYEQRVSTPTSASNGASTGFPGRRAGLLAAALLVALAGVAVWRGLPEALPTSSGPSGGDAPATAVRRGGGLVGSVRAEPRSFNSYVQRGATEETVSFLTQSKLVRVNRVTDTLEPWLAASWELVDAPAPGPVYRLALREDVTFSDGAPFTSADVLFAFEAVYDERTASPTGESLRVGGEKLAVRALGDHVVEIAFPAPYGPGLRVLDTLWILPRHKLAPALAAGTLADAWAPSVAPAEVVGLGPFVLAGYRPGERMTFARNPRYWRRDDEGRELPYLDRLTLEILPDQAAELLRVESGQLDLTHSEIRSEDYAALRRARDEGRVNLVDVGIGLDPDAFWFNLAPSTSSGVAKPWLRERAFRQAVSLAVDRAAYADAVFLGAAEPLHGPVTSGNRTWYWPELPGGEYDPAAARRLLAGMGLADRDDDGTLEDEGGRPVRFTVVLQRGIAAVERGAAFVRDALAQVGVGLDVVGLEAGAVVARWQSGNYDAIFHRLLLPDTDPSTVLDFWLSSGATHLWNPGQATPATDWERQIDELMARQVAAADQDERVRLFREVQRIFSDESPVLYFAAQRLFIPTSTRVAGATPSRLRPALLWNADTLAVRE